MRLLQKILEWSEVWALLIPLIVIIVRKPDDHTIRILARYTVVAFLLNFTAIFMLEFYNLVPQWMYIEGMVNNNIIYNTHSTIRVLFFGAYIIALRPFRKSLLIKVVLAAYIGFVFINFIFIESPFFLSSRHFAAESMVLLIICLSYFFRSLQDESDNNWLKHPSFLISAGISLYEVITFFIFLFFYQVSEKEPDFFLFTMRVYSIAYILLCILLAIVFMKSKRTAT